MKSNKNSSRGRQEGKKKTPLNRKSTKKEFKKIKETPQSDASSGIRLNKYIANSGICSRREADTYIEHGSVEINGKLITEMGYKVQPDDVVRDPVCSALIQPEEAYASLDYQGQRYYFCCPVCQGAFQAEPGAYHLGA